MTLEDYISCKPVYVRCTVTQMSNLSTPAIRSHGPVQTLVWERGPAAIVHEYHHSYTNVQVPHLYCETFTH
jgi:hypothetical protein